MILSLILPVFNVEKYLAKCINSCLDQNISTDSYEIIIVIDGSIDNSITIAKHYAEQYTNIYIIEQQNRGLSAARNTGLKHSKGQYVWFIDSDDCIEKNSLNEIVLNLLEKKPEILLIDYYKIDTKNNIISSSSINLQYEHLSMVTGLDYFEKRAGDFLLAVRYICNKKFLLENNLQFHEGILHEDNEFTPRLLFYAKKIMIYNKLPIYAYYIRNNSIMNTFNPKKIDSILIIAKSLSLFRDSLLDNTQYQILLNEYILQFMSNYLQSRNIYEIPDDYDIIEFKKINALDIKLCNTFRSRVKGLLIKYAPMVYANYVNKIKLLTTG